MSLRNFGLILLATIFSVSGFANSELEQEVESETTIVKESPAQITTQEVYVIQGQDQEQGQKATSAASPAVTTQPTTIVEASPLFQSRADQMRAARQQSEIQTEQKIVEKLEESRLQDEKKRADRLFGNKLDNEETAEVVAPKAEQPAKLIIVEKVAEEKKEEAAPRKSDEELKNEISESVKADLAKIKDEEKSKDKGRMTVSGQLGTVSYDAVNIGSDFSAGATFGWEMDNGMEIEAGLIYSNHIVDENYFNMQEMDQYNWSLAAKYHILPTRITPVVGGLVSLTQRNYSVPYYVGADNFDSLALDAGLLIGADLKISDNMSLGLEYRRLVNVATRYENDAHNRPLYNSYRDPIEEQDYDMTNLSLRFLF